MVDIKVLTVGTALPPAALASLRALMSSGELHYHPSSNAPADVLTRTEVYYSTNKGLPPSVTDVSVDMPQLKHLQLQSAGADKLFKNEALCKALDGGDGPFTIATASGTHAVSIPQYIVGTLLALYHRLPQQIIVARNEARWATGDDIVGGSTGDATALGNETSYSVRSLRGKTVGFLGYGAIARAAARLLLPFGVSVIAANTNGDRRIDDGFVFEGTGDPEAALPSEFFATSESTALDAFLARSDVLVCSLPSTKDTHYLLTRERLALLPSEAVLINVGRGDLVRSEDLLEALDRPGGLFGLAIDVTDPEPLPHGHPLWTHPKAIVTPHLSGDAEGELAVGAEILEFNIKRMREGRPIVNRVDWAKGY